MGERTLSSNWQVLGASVPGTSHLQAGLGCDDAHAYRLHENHLLCLAVADGAGSASRSALGAAIAVQTALDTAELLLREQIEPSQLDQWQSILSQVLQAAHRALIQQAMGDLPLDAPLQSAPPPDQLNTFATTLLFTSVTKHWIAVAQIGDGAIVVQRSDGIIESLTARSQHEYINETSFLTDADYLLQADYTVLPSGDIQGIAMLTDGLQMISMNYPRNTPHQPFFAQMFAFASRPASTEAELQAFLASERVCTRTEDDKTLVLAVYQ